jgi:hypothetical protein
MKKALPVLVVLLSMFAVQAVAQEHYTEGPVWRCSLVRVNPGQMDTYLTSLRISSKPLIDAEKKQGLILDYKVFLKETKENEKDWDIAVCILYKNHAALDGLAAKAEAVRDQVSSKQAMQAVADKRVAVREVISSMLMQEVTLKDPK